MRSRLGANLAMNTWVLQKNCIPYSISEPFDVSGILGMSHINGHLQNVSLAGTSGVSHLSASSSLGQSRLSYVAQLRSAVSNSNV